MERVDEGGELEAAGVTGGGHVEATRAAATQGIQVSQGRQDGEPRIGFVVGTAYEHQWGMVHFIINDKSFIGRGYVIVNLVH